MLVSVGNASWILAHRTFNDPTQALNCPSRTPFVIPNSDFVIFPPRSPQPLPKTSIPRLVPYKSNSLAVKFGVGRCARGLGGVGRDETRR